MFYSTMRMNAVDFKHRYLLWLIKFWIWYVDGWFTFQAIWGDVEMWYTAVVCLAYRKLAEKCCFVAFHSSNYFIIYMIKFMTKLHASYSLPEDLLSIWINAMTICQMTNWLLKVTLKLDRFNDLNTIQSIEMHWMVLSNDFANTISIN